MKRHPMVGVIEKIFPRTDTARIKFKICSRTEPLSSLLPVETEHIKETEVGPLDKTFVWWPS